MKTKSLLGLAALLLGVQLTAAQSTAFTYQGRLNDGTNPANGRYDLQFQVFDAASGGASYGSPDPNNLSPVIVSNGLFTVVLDFGSGVFAGADRWLQVSARTNGTGLFVNLTPRQKLTPTPYAIFAGSASTLGTNGVLLGTPTFGNTTGAPFIANSTTKVNNLNADYLDGLDSTAFWQLGGNAGTTPGANYLGASDGAQVRLHSTGGFLVDDATPSLSFSATTRQMLNLYHADFGLGVQDYTFYSRSGDSFAWYAGGVHSSTRNDPGTGGTTLMTLDSAANLAINGALTVDANSDGDGSVGTGLRFGSGSGQAIVSRSTPGANQKGLDFFANSLPRMSILNSGNVGIGTITPVKALQVGDNSIRGSEGMMRFASHSASNSATQRAWDIGVPQTGEDVSGVGYSFVIDDPGTGTGPEFMIKYGSGNVGIGTTNPASKLVVVGDFDVDATPLNATFAKMVMHGGGPISFLGNANDRTLYLGRNANPDVAVQVGTGNVGIGTTSPQAKLDVNGDIKARNLPGLSTSQSNGSVGTHYLNQVNATVDSITLNVPAKGVLLVSAFVHTVGPWDTNEDFKLLQAGVELVKTTSGTKLAEHTLFWVVPVSAAGSLSFQTILWRVADLNGNFGGDYFAHNLTAVYLPVQY